MRYPFAVGILTFLVNFTILSILYQALPWTYYATFPEGGVWWLERGWWFRICYAGLFAPILEEAIFRAGVMGFFQRREMAVPGLVISSFAFGLYHMFFGWGWLKAVDMTVVGMVFGWSFLRYGFRGAAACHLGNNWASLTLLALN